MRITRQSLIHAVVRHLSTLRAVAHAFVTAKTKVVIKSHVKSSNCVSMPQRIIQTRGSQSARNRQENRYDHGLGMQSLAATERQPHGRGEYKTHFKPVTKLARSRSKTAENINTEPRRSPRQYEPESSCTCKLDHQLVGRFRQP